MDRSMKPFQLLQDDYNSSQCGHFLYHISVYLNVYSALTCISVALYTENILAMLGTEDTGGNEVICEEDELHQARCLDSKMQTVFDRFTFAELAAVTRHTELFLWAARQWWAHCLRINALTFH